MIHFLGWYVMRKEEYKLNIEHAKTEARFISSLRGDERTRLLCKIDEEREKRQEARAGVCRGASNVHRRGEKEL